MERLDVFFNEDVQRLIDSFAYCFKVHVALFSTRMEALFMGLHNEGSPYCLL